MSALVCSLSGNPIIEGVVSSKTGHLYEKSTILKHIKAFGTCPHTNQPLANTDLVDVQNLNNSFFTQNRSISQCLQKLTNQYDTLILQGHMLKQQLRQSRQELATSLYHQDAALRVICKLKQQLRGKKQQLAQVIEQIRLIQNA